MIEFKSSIIKAVLSADLRGNVTFSLWRLTDNSMNNWVPISTERPLACEYLADLYAVSFEAMTWIAANCEEVKEEEQHLYYRFKEAT